MKNKLTYFEFHTKLMGNIFYLNNKKISKSALYWSGKTVGSILTGVTSVKVVELK